MATLTSYRIDVSIPLSLVDDPFLISEDLCGVAEQVEGLSCTDSGTGFGYRDIGFGVEGEVACSQAISLIERFLLQAGIPVNDGEESAQLHSTNY
jgi:hypothetical protein